MQEIIRQMDEVSRRRFVAGAAQLFLGVTALPSLGASAGGGAGGVNKPAKNVIYLFMNGGMSHLDTLDPKPGAEVQGPVEAIKTAADGVRVSEHLPRLAEQMDKAAIIRSLTSKQGAHERGRYFVRTSYLPRSTAQHPGLGAWVLRLKGEGETALPGNVLIGGGGDHPGAGFMGTRYTPLRIGSPNKGLQNAQLPKGVSPRQFERRLALARKFDRNFRRRYPHEKVNAYNDFYEDAVSLMKSRDLKAFELNRERSEVRQAYGNNRLGQGCLLARRLVEHGVRFVEVESGGWDMHGGIFNSIGGRAGQLDQALSTLLQDLQSKGMLEETLVVLTTEFGRTPNINDNTGRDHHPRVFSGLLAGGPVKGGRVYGKSDEKAYEVAEDAVSPTDFNKTVGYALGLPVDRTIRSDAGRPFQLGHDGKPIKALF